MLQVNFHPFPVLYTPRLVLRQMTSEDAPAWYRMRSDKEVMQLIARPIATCVEDVLELMAKLQAGIENNELISWAISLQSNKELIGTIGFYRIKKEHYRAEIGYMLAKEQQGNGIMQEAIKEVIWYGFQEMNLHSVEAVIAPANTASRRVVEKAGFKQEGFFKENEFFEGRFISKMVYSLLAGV